MIYPEHLLLQSNYKFISETDELCFCTLVRHTSSKDLFLAETETIDPDKLQIQSGHLKDLSTNLLGIFKIEDIYVEVINKKFYDLWNVGENVVTPLIHKDFCFNNDRGFFFFNIKEIIYLELPLILSYTILFKVIHTPTKCNFWHFSIRAYSKNIEISEMPISENQKKKIWKSLKDFLVGIAYTSCTVPNIINKQYYTNNSFLKV
jgi:hypothetical protein